MPIRRDVKSRPDRDKCGLRGWVRAAQAADNRTRCTSRVHPIPLGWYAQSRHRPGSAAQSGSARRRLPPVFCHSACPGDTLLAEMPILRRTGVETFLQQCRWAGIWDGASPAKFAGTPAQHTPPPAPTDMKRAKKATHKWGRPVLSGICLLSAGAVSQVLPGRAAHLPEMQLVL